MVYLRAFSVSLPFSSLRYCLSSSYSSQDVAHLAESTAYYIGVDKLGARISLSPAKSKQTRQKCSGTEPIFFESTPPLPMPIGKHQDNQEKATLEPSTGSPSSSISLTCSSSAATADQTRGSKEESTNAQCSRETLPVNRQPTARCSCCTSWSWSSELPYHLGSQSEAECTTLKGERAGSKFRSYLPAWLRATMDDCIFCMEPLSPTAEGDASSPLSVNSSAASPQSTAVRLNSRLKAPGQILYEDDLVYAIEDHRPAAEKHLLVIPKEHINSVFTLNSEHLGLVKHMQSVANTLIPERGQERRFGFHLPPFYSIPHLHLHCLELPLKSRWRWYAYWPTPVPFTAGKLYFFKPVEQVIIELSSEASPSL